MTPAPSASRIKPWHHRLGIALRAIAAVIGGYALASLVSALAALTLPLPREEAILAGSLVALAVYPAVAVWCFAASGLGRVWIGLGVPGGLLALAVWLLRGTL